MPRRRMISPEFWTDRKIGYLTRDQRDFILGSIGQADDEGRLQADPAFLKAEIYKYDDDLDSAAVKELRDSCLTKMKSWPSNHPYRMDIYTNSDEEYIFFPNWDDIQKPSHPTKSKLPAPPPELLPIFSKDFPEALPNSIRGAPPQSSLGQSSLGQVSLVKSSAVQEDFTKFLTNEKDLTDFLTTTLNKYMPRGPTYVMPVIKKLWREGTGKDMNTDLFQVIFTGLPKYPIPVLAKSLSKAVKYTPGKKKPANYLAIVFDEQMAEFEKEKHGRSPPG